MNKGDYLVVITKDTEILFFYVRDTKYEKYLLETLDDIVFEIISLGLLRTFDVDEIDAKKLFEFTLPEIEGFGDYKVFHFQEAALGYIGRELECMHKEGKF